MANNFLTNSFNIHEEGFFNDIMGLINNFIHICQRFLIYLLFEKNKQYLIY
jgi:hypothetical protein